MTMPVSCSTTTLPYLEPREEKTPPQKIQEKETSWLCKVIDFADQYPVCTLGIIAGAIASIPAIPMVLFAYRDQTDYTPTSLLYPIEKWTHICFSERCENTEDVANSLLNGNIRESLYSFFPKNIYRPNSVRWAFQNENLWDRVYTAAKHGIFECNSFDISGLDDKVLTPNMGNQYAEIEKLFNHPMISDQKLAEFIQMLKKNSSDLELMLDSGNTDDAQKCFSKRLEVEMLSLFFDKTDELTSFARRFKKLMTQEKIDFSDFHEDIQKALAKLSRKTGVFIGDVREKEEEASYFYERKFTGDQFKNTYKDFENSNFFKQNKKIFEDMWKEFDNLFGNSNKKQHQQKKLEAEKSTKSASELLNISIFDSKATVKEKCNKGLKVYHTDRNSHPNAIDQFQKVYDYCKKRKSRR